jgi:hypothetical protein
MPAPLYLLFKPIFKSIQQLPTPLAISSSPTTISPHHQKLSSPSMKCDMAAKYFSKRAANELSEEWIDTKEAKLQ